MLTYIFNTIKFLLQRKSKFVGRDENGNSYYESDRGKRWVTYSGLPQPTTVPPDWHMWLHYTDDTVPVNGKKIKIKHTYNFMDVRSGYYLNQKVRNYYKSWNPNS